MHVCASVRRYASPYVCTVVFSDKESQTSGVGSALPVSGGLLRGLIKEVALTSYADCPMDFVVRDRVRWSPVVCVHMNASAFPSQLDTGRLLVLMHVVAGCNASE